MSCEARENEQGFLLLGLVVAIFIILLFLAVAAPTVAHELRREQEVETVHRGNQYVRAIQLYYRKFGHYPGSMEQLEKTSEIRFLRRQYVDPMTGKADWRLIKVGEAKTTVKGFFGKPLTGLAPGLGSAAGMASGGGIGAGAAGTSGATGSTFGSSGPTSVFGGTSSPGSSSGSSFGDTSSSPTSGLGSSGSASSGPGSSTAGGTSGSDSSGFGSNSGMGSQSATSFTGGGAPFEGVGLVKDGDSIVTLNEQTTYKTWEFIYDPRIEQLKAAAALQGGGANGLGVGGSSSSGSGSSSGFGNSSGSGFGNSSGSVFGNSSGATSGFGSSSPASSSPTSSGSGSSSP